MTEILSHQEDGQWAVYRLVGPCCRLDGSPVRSGSGAGSGSPADHVPVMCHIPNLDDWAILVPEAVRVYVNGRTVAANIQVLHHWDQVRIENGAPVIFSTREQITIEAYPENLEPVTCARCNQFIRSGHRVVRCPKCQIFAHEDSANEHACWSYADVCPNPYCDQPTASGGGELDWNPEECIHG